MKKTTFFMACCLSLMLLVSCKKDPIAPIVNVFNGVGYVTEGSFVYSGDEITVGFVATGENLTKMEVTLSQNGSTLSYYSEELEKLASYSLSHTLTVNATGTVTITGTITDAAGQTAFSSFNILCEEKPNAKFVGHYEGNALATGTMEINMNGNPFNQEFTDREVLVILDLVEGESMYEVIGTCKMNDNEITCKGNVEGNTVTFEAFEEIFTYPINIPGFFSFSPEIKMTYCIRGTLTNGKLMLDGICSGHGDINTFISSGTLLMESTIGGALTKK